MLSATETPEQPKVDVLPLMSKQAVADEVVKRVVDLLATPEAAQPQ